MVEVEALRNFYDMKRKKNVKKGDKWKCSDERALSLSSGDNDAKIPLVVCIGEPSPTPMKEVDADEKDDK